MNGIGKTHEDNIFTQFKSLTNHFFLHSPNQVANELDIYKVWVSPAGTAGVHMLWHLPPNYQVHVAFKTKALKFCKPI